MENPAASPPVSLQRQQPKQKQTSHQVPSLSMAFEPKFGSRNWPISTNLPLEISPKRRTLDSGKKKNYVVVYIVSIMEQKVTLCSVFSPPSNIFMANSRCCALAMKLSVLLTITPPKASESPPILPLLCDWRLELWSNESNLSEFRGFHPVLNIYLLYALVLLAIGLWCYYAITTVILRDGSMKLSFVRSWNLVRVALLLEARWRFGEMPDRVGGEFSCFFILGVSLLLLGLTYFLLHVALFWIFLYICVLCCFGCLMCNVCLTSSPNLSSVVVW